MILWVFVSVIRMLLSLFFLCEISVWAQQIGYTIRGTIAGKDNTLLTLVVAKGVELDTLGTTSLSRGSFDFTGKVDGVRSGYILAPGGQLVASFMLENADYTISDGGIVTGGGPAQALFARFNALNEELLVERKKLEEAYREAEAAGDTKKAQAVDARFRDFLADMQARELKLLMENADSYVAAHVVASTMTEVGLEKLRQRFELLGESAKASDWGKAIEDQIIRYERVEVGGIAPDFEIPSRDGGVVSLQGTKAKVKIIDFWASWCAPCRQGNVNLVKLYQQYRPRGLEIISVSLDDNRQAWEKACGEDGMLWLNGSDLKGQFSPLVSLYCLRGIPANFILDEENRIVAKNLFGKQLQQKIAELLGK